ncbi:DUF3275 family protein [Corticibacter populi]|uniref:DUF3275 family protein n=1 Tax=Corticibacter populi TaxID=1550736 RepID=A0A3M6QZ84_9BURK|nr:DUF3275 family protein [Corticibacter populi]RMX08223.1 DUF3275 family protein [Corticibacter populi]RZS35492.1 uncharacterized protein DUF3275 [Corticibacter populi]
MIKLENVTLRVKQIRGSNGYFCVADLLAEEGLFKVKDPLLDQFSDGEYTGTVWISEIYLAQYVSYGKGVTEIRARLHDLRIDGVDALQEQEEPIEPDPADEAQTLPLPTTPTEAPVPSEAEVAPRGLDALRKKLAGIGRKQPPAATPDPDTLESLFGEHWPAVLARDPVKLDSTVDRLRFRAQIAKLKELDYELDPRSQTWMPSH